MQLQMATQPTLSRQNNVVDCLEQITLYIHTSGESIIGSVHEKPWPCYDHREQLSGYIFVFHTR